jgi:hypothetical protein
MSSKKKERILTNKNINDLEVALKTKEQEIYDRVSSEAEEQSKENIKEINERYDTMIAAVKDQIGACKESLKRKSTRKNTRSFNNRLSTFRSHIFKCQSTIRSHTADITRLEKERKDELKDNEDFKKEHIARFVRREIHEQKEHVRMMKFLKHLQSKSVL